jgi:hypothetical protein
MQVKIIIDAIPSQPFLVLLVHVCDNYDEMR